MGSRAGVRAGHHAGSRAKVSSGLTTAGWSSKQPQVKRGRELRSQDVFPDDILLHAEEQPLGWESFASIQDCVELDMGEIYPQAPLLINVYLVQYVLSSFRISDQRAVSTESNRGQVQPHATCQIRSHCCPPPWSTTWPDHGRSRGTPSGLSESGRMLDWHSPRRIPDPDNPDLNAR